MSWFCTFFQSKQPDLKIVRPLDLDELPTTRLELRACEAAVIDHLISIHARLHALEERPTQDSDANRILLQEKKTLFERRLETVRAKVKEIQSNQ